MKLTHRMRLFPNFILLAWLLAVAVTARAEVTHTFNSLAITNYSGFVIASDAANAGAGYNRESIHVQTSVTYGRNNTTTTNVFEYQYQYRLLNSQGVAQSLRIGLGTGTVITNTLTVDRSGIFILVPTFNDADLIPSAPLDPFERYQVEFRLLRRVIGARNFGDTGVLQKSALQPYLHFASQSANDAALNVLSFHDSAAWNRTYLVQTDGAKNQFRAAVDWHALRYDGFGLPVTVDPIVFTFDLELRDATTQALVPLVTNRVTVIRNLASHTAVVGLADRPASNAFSATIAFAPANGVQLDPLNKTYKLKVTMGHIETPGDVLPKLAGPGAVKELPAQRLLHFNGKLFFGAIETRFTSIANDPGPILIQAGQGVVSTLAVDNQSGFIQGHPDHTYGDGTALDILLRPNGNAELRSGSVAVTEPVPNEDDVNGIRMVRGEEILSPAGLNATIATYFPAGFGITGIRTSKLLLWFSAFSNVALNQQLLPISDPSATPANPWWAVEETKPVRMEFTTVKWVVSSGRFDFTATGAAEYVRMEEMGLLAAAPVAAQDKVKPSNEGYYNYVDGLLDGQFVVEADSNGAALLSARLKFKNGAVLPHYPLNSVTVWTGTGEQDIKKDLVEGALEGVSGIVQSYNRDCLMENCSGGVGPKLLNFKPAADKLVFTRDGGLHADGLLTAPERIQWGWIDLPAVQKYAQNTDPFSVGAFLMSGHFVRGGQSAKPLNDRAAVILYTGFRQAGNLVERPGTGGYANGFADYAGMNFRAESDGLHKGQSTIASQDTGEYPLTGRSKLYARLSGVSGIHEAVLGQFPPDFTLYGYEMKFSNYGLAYLDSENVDSRTEGSIFVPNPSEFTQNFEKLTFTCLGALKDAEVPSDEGNLKKVLAYWNADFYTRAISFDRKGAAGCDPGQGFLVLGVDAFANQVDSTLFGQLGFRPNGNLITLADNLLDPPFDSRLKLPNNFKVKGPKQEKYNVIPVNDAYLSNWDYRNSNKDDQGALRPGFINLAGKLDVPFFEDLQVHFHTTPDKEAPADAPIHMMGGWASGKGFETAGKNFFNASVFDTDNKGFPDDAPALTYEQGFAGTNDKYRVRAVRNWLDVVTFNVPMKWSSSTRAFTAFAPVKTDLLVINVEYSCKYLSAENAELTFGIQYDGLPQVNLSNLVFDQLDGMFNAFENVVQAEVIGAGFGALNQLLDSIPRDLFQPVFDGLLDQPVEALYQALKSNYDAAQKKWVNPPTGIIQQYCGLAPGVVNNFKKTLTDDLLGTVNSATGFIKQVDSKLGDAEAALGQIENLLAEAGDGNRQLVTQLLKQLVKTLVQQTGDNPIAQSVGQLAADLVGGALDPQLNEFLKKADPTLDEIQSVIAALHTKLAEARDKLSAGGNFPAEFAQELTDKLNAISGEVTTAMTKACNDINGVINTFNLAADNPFTPAAKQQLKDLIRQKLEDRFFGSQIPAAFTTILKQRLYELEGAAREAVDSVFAQVNSTIRDVLSQSLAEIDNSINGLLGPVSDTMGAGRINGYAHINNDSLKLLRIDLHAEFKVPSEMQFNAYLQIKELDSESEENGCIGPGEKATEVRIGATDVEVDFISPDLRASIEAKFTFQTEPSFSILGVGAGFELNGELSFATFKITYLGAQLAFGAEENYFSGACALSFNSYKAKGGIYFGRTCTLDPFFWDTDVQSLIGQPPFTGIYAYGEVWIPVSEALLGIPASCFFEVSAGVGLGAGFFIEGPTFVGKMFLGAYGSVLCLASLEGDIKLVGVKNPDGLQLKGSGRLEGCLGPCPFCLCAEKTIGITYQNSKWDVDF
jgi:hypothetical protein